MTAVLIYSLYSSLAHAEGEGLGSRLMMDDLIQTPDGPYYRHAMDERTWSERLIEASDRRRVGSVQRMGELDAGAALNAAALPRTRAGSLSHRGRKSSARRARGTDHPAGKQQRRRAYARSSLCSAWAETSAPRHWSSGLGEIRRRVRRSFTG